MKSIKPIGIIIAMCILISCMSGAAAADTQEPIKVYYNGNIIEFDTQPVIADSRTMVPLRVFFRLQRIAEVLKANKKNR